MKKVVILGGGYSGLGSAFHLLKNSNFDVTIVEKNPIVGGLASSFEENKKFFPLGYHHILQNETPLLDITKELGLYDSLRWKKIKMLFWINKLYTLTNPIHFLSMPLSFRAKIRFGLFMVKNFLRKDWTSLENIAADEWLLKEAGTEVKEKIFDRLIEIKFGVESSKVSAAWLGSRIGKREGSSKFGYMPGKDWTRVIATALADQIREKKGKILLNATATKIILKNNAVSTIQLSNGKHLDADIVISTLPPHIFLKMIPAYPSSPLQSIKYVNTVSCLVSTNQKLPEFYWLVALWPRLSISGLFDLTNLNETLGTGDERIINFFTHLKSEDLFIQQDDGTILNAYLKDFKRIFNFDLKANWIKINRIKNSSPVFVKGYKNPEPKSSIPGLYFAGNYMTYPFITSTSTALLSGTTTAEAIIKNERT